MVLSNCILTSTQTRNKHFRSISELILKQIFNCDNIRANIGLNKFVTSKNKGGTPPS